MCLVYETTVLLHLLHTQLLIIQSTLAELEILNFVLQTRHIINNYTNMCTVHNFH